MMIEVNVVCLCANVMLQEAFEVVLAATGLSFSGLGFGLEKSSPEQMLDHTPTAAIGLVALGGSSCGVCSRASTTPRL